MRHTRIKSFELVQNFSVRFKQIVNELKYAVRSEHSSPTERKIAVSIEVKESLKPYLLNLKREIGLSVRAQKPTSLVEALNQAIETQNQANKTIPKPTHRPTPRPYPTPRVPIHSMPLSSRAEMRCYKSNKIGYISNQCGQNRIQIFRII